MQNKKKETEKEPAAQAQSESVYANNEDYIRACSDALDALECYDLELMGVEYKERAAKMKEKIFNIIEYSINEIYEELEFVLPDPNRED